VSPKRKRRFGKTLVDVLVLMALTAILTALLWWPLAKKDLPSPVHTRFYLGLGNRLVNQGKLDEAVAAYRKALARHPDLALSYLNLGNALARQKKIPEAVTALRRALELAPDPARAYDNLVSILGLTSPKQQGQGDARGLPHGRHTPWQRPP
jgi:tetratricopeptide (TPR) repeat protein